MNRQPDVYYKRRIYFTIFPSGPTGLDDPNFEYVYDFKTKTFSELNIKRPEIYRQKTYGNSHSIFSNRSKGPDDLFLFSWGADPKIQVTNFEDVDTSYSAESDYFDEIHPVKPGEDEHINFMENGIYDVIIWDKYREVYYRLAWQGIPNIDAVTNLPDLGENKPCSVIILDKNFNKIGETMLSKKKFLLRDWFLSKKGLFISNSHPQSTSLSENKMSFIKLTLTSNEK